MMCMILYATNFKGGTVLGCSEYNGEFLNSKTLKILDNNQNVFSTNDFMVEETRDCFGKGGLPLVMTKNPVAANFQRKGNTVLFE